MQQAGLKRSLHSDISEGDMVLGDAMRDPQKLGPILSEQFRCECSSCRAVSFFRGGLSTEKRRTQLRQISSMSF